jgi:hypothetical protein
MTKASDRTSDFLGDLGDAVKRNPLPAALVGMGIMWLFSNRSHIADAGSGVARSFGQGAGWLVKSTSDEVQSGLSTASKAASDQVTSSIDAVKEGASRMSDAVSSSFDPVPAMVGDAFDNIRDNLSETFRRQPLALGVLGLAVGAAVAASMPVSDAENEYLGDTSDLLKAKAGEIFEEKSQQAVELGAKVVDAVADEAEKQGLTPSQLKSAATELKDKVVRLGDAAQGTRNQQQLN